jgi:DNA-binding transcriptional regulator YhcF (GntR family)
MTAEFQAAPIDSSSSVPPFEQLRVGIAGRIATGELPSGTKLPTVRQLAFDLGLAPNTVARAYRELEADGIVVTDGRRGTFVHSTKLQDADPAGVAEQAASYAVAARRAGLTAPEAVRLVQRAWRAPDRADEARRLR